ncbi:MAG: hypothetical protein RLY14_2030 [Planctomycetota bacterium]
MQNRFLRDSADSEENITSLEEILEAIRLIGIPIGSWSLR